MGRESAESTRMNSRDLSVKVTFEPATKKGSSYTKIWSWNIPSNKTAKGPEVGEGGKKAKVLEQSEQRG